jgi:uncharacterized protein with HEPN domain
MTQHDETVRLRHMLEAAREAVELSRGRSRGDLATQRLVELALTRLVETVGEAASRIPKEIQGRSPDIPWTQIVTMRHRLVHGYDAVDPDLLWSTVTEDLPALIPLLERVLAERA